MLGKGIELPEVVNQLGASGADVLVEVRMTVEPDELEAAVSRPARTAWRLWQLPVSATGRTPSARAAVTSPASCRSSQCTRQLPYFALVARSRNAVVVRRRPCFLCVASR